MWRVSCIQQIIYLTRNDAMAKNAEMGSGFKCHDIHIGDWKWKIEAQWSERGTNIYKSSAYFQHMQIKVDAANQIWSFFPLTKINSFYETFEHQSPGKVLFDCGQRDFCHFIYVCWALHLFGLLVHKSSCGRVPTKFAGLLKLFVSVDCFNPFEIVRVEGDPGQLKLYFEPL